MVEVIKEHSKEKNIDTNEQIINENRKKAKLARRKHEHSEYLKGLVYDILSIIKSNTVEKKEDDSTILSRLMPKSKETDEEEQNDRLLESYKNEAVQALVAFFMDEINFFFQRYSFLYQTKSEIDFVTNSIVGKIIQAIDSFDFNKDMDFDFDAFITWLIFAFVCLKKICTTECFNMFSDESTLSENVTYYFEFEQDHYSMASCSINEYKAFILEDIYGIEFDEGPLNYEFIAEYSEKFKEIISKIKELYTPEKIEENTKEKMLIKEAE